MKPTPQQLLRIFSLLMVCVCFSACAQRDNLPTTPNPPSNTALSLDEKPISELMAMVSTPKTPEALLQNIHFAYVHHLSDNEDFFTEDNLKHFFGGQQVWYKGRNPDGFLVPCPLSDDGKFEKHCPFKNIDEIEISYPKGQLRNILVTISSGLMVEHRYSRERIPANVISADFTRRKDLDQLNLNVVQGLFGKDTDKCPSRMSDLNSILYVCYFNAHRSSSIVAQASFDLESNQSLNVIGLYSTMAYYYIYLSPTNR